MKSSFASNKMEGNPLTEKQAEEDSLEDRIKLVSLSAGWCNREET